MGFRAWIVVGAIAGFLACQVMRARESLLTMVALGIVCGLVGGFVASNVLKVGSVDGINLESVVIATLGAIAVVFSGAPRDRLAWLPGSTVSPSSDSGTLRRAGGHRRRSVISSVGGALDEPHRRSRSRQPLTSDLGTAAARLRRIRVRVTAASLVVTRLEEGRHESWASCAAI